METKEPTIYGMTLENIIGGIFFAGAFFTIIGQVLFFLFAGHWLSLSVLTPFQILSGPDSWFNAPTMLYGFHKVFSFLPLWVTL